MPILEKDKNNQNLVKENLNQSSWIEIDEAALTHNINSYKNISNPANLAVVLKSNAYGHGIKEIAQICDKNNNVNMICVVSLSEAILLKSISIKKPILILSIIDGDLQEAISKDIELVVFDIGFAIKLNNLAKTLSKKVNIHIKVDTGLSRLGILAEEAADTIKVIHNLSNIIIKGIFTHFAESESENQDFTNLQIQRFNKLIKSLEELGINIAIKHAACSAAVTANIKSHFNMVRVGIGLYGLWPSQENKIVAEKEYSQFKLKPVLTWKTKIIQIKDITKDSFVGYDRTYQAKKESKIAVLPIGYWDGYDRRLSNKGQVVINNQLAPVVGRVAMNLTMVDVTNINASINDEVILLGNYNGITANDIAKSCETINYEIVTRINPTLIRKIS